MIRSMALILALAGCTNSTRCPTGMTCLADFSGGVSHPPDEWSTPDGFGAGGEPEEWGAVLGSFCGIDAYQNGPSVGYFDGSSPYGLRYQCTELAYRFACQAWGMCDAKNGLYGNAGQWWDNPHGDPVLAALTRHANGGGVPPEPGDLITFAGPEPYGHVAVVASVDLIAGTITVIEQNCHSCSHAHVLDTSSGYTVSGAQGWMRGTGSLACGSEPQPDLTITAPVAGDRWLQDTPYIVRWESNHNADVQVWIKKGGVRWFQLAAETSNDGTLDFEPLSSSFPADCDYSTEIESKDGVVRDESGWFCIDDPTVDLDGDGFEAAVDCDDLEPAVYPGAPEACNGLDDSCTGLIDDNWDCWVTHYRFVSAQGTYCWGDDVTPPPACAEYTLDREAWVAATEPVPGTYELVQCSSVADPVVHDHILVERGDPDYNALLGIYDCSLSLGYLYRDVQAPAAGSTWFANSCDVWRYAHDAGHLFTSGVDDTGGMTCEKDVGIAMSDQGCHIPANGGC